MDPAEIARQARGRRYAQREKLRGLTRLDRVGGCGTATVEPFVPVRVNGAGQASYGGVITCGSMWACPVCSAAERQRRAVVVEARAKAWLAQRFGLVFLTLTLPHTMADDLGELLDVAYGAWRKAQQRGGVRRALADLGYVGPLRATEITHGYNGWHPHHHLLLFFRQRLTETQAKAVEALIWRAWSDAVAGYGRKAPSREHGAVLYRVGMTKRDASALGAYLCKLQGGDYETDAATGVGKRARWSAAHEMVRGDLKRGRAKHRTPFEILDAAALGSKRSLALWRVYEAATKGRRCMQWGQKLEAELAGLAVELPTEGDGVVVVELSASEWQLLRCYGRTSQMLSAVERSGLIGAHELLRVLFRRHRFELARLARPDVAQRVERVS